MEKIPTLSRRDRIYFRIINILFIVPPFYIFLSILVNVPEYFTGLIKIGPVQPLGWIFMSLIVQDLGILSLLVYRSIKYVEGRPIKKSIIDMVIIMFLVLITFTIIIQLPALFLFLQLLIHFV
jgi:hypothetical protein